MKSKKIIYLEKILRFMAQVVIKKYKPKIIGITGSVGKTSAKEAVSLVLSDKFNIRSGQKNYNNEIGIPLTIIGAKSGEGSILGWIRVFFKWMLVVIFPVRYPEIVVLELGIDRPGDMDYLLGFIPVNVAILTDISGSHLEYFGNINRIAKEKYKIVEAVAKEGVAIINIDNEKIKEQLEKHKKDNEINGMTFGFDEDAMVRATDTHFNYRNNEVSGISFKLNYEGKIIPIRLDNVIAKHHLYAVLAGISSGIYFKVNPIEIANSLKDYFPPQGRMTLIEGVNGSMVIDDTYNASKVSTLAALNILSEIEARRKLIALGDMLELGPTSHSDHIEVARRALEVGDKIFVAGKRMEEAISEMIKTDNISKDDQKKMQILSNPVAVAQSVKNVIEPGDIILVKGSQSMRMEKVVEEVIARTVDVEKKLCRQSREWKNKPFIQP
ncbi:MAG: UDP-N-acetylmuramoyl-tripeptide--D-alanyl-D-alanine ligase [Candidatus Moranbacteria bacterium]|nr:UDP-N-acetylmuramoyl-tripeptide--D-alanyl-D-alanine ligase [Candidatus Moranbacteria bacterium]